MKNTSQEFKMLSTKILLTMVAVSSMTITAQAGKVSLIRKGVKAIQNSTRVGNDKIVQSISQNFNKKLLETRRGAIDQASDRLRLGYSYKGIVPVQSTIRAGTLSDGSSYILKVETGNVGSLGGKFTSRIKFITDTDNDEVIRDAMNILNDPQRVSSVSTTESGRQVVVTIDMKNLDKVSDRVAYLVAKIESQGLGASALPQLSRKSMAGVR